MLPFCLIESMMAWHLPRVRDAMLMSPSSALFWAHLCAAT